MRALITVAGVALPIPSTYVGTTVDIVDSGRNAQGEIVSNVVRHNVAKVEATWNYLTRAEWSAILKLFKSNFINSVTFLDQVEDTWVTRKMYPGDRKPSGIVSADGELIGYKSCKLSLVEV